MSWNTKQCNTIATKNTHNSKRLFVLCSWNQVQYSRISILLVCFNFCTETIKMAIWPFFTLKLSRKGLKVERLIKSNMSIVNDINFHWFTHQVLKRKQKQLGNKPRCCQCSWRLTKYMMLWKCLLWRPWFTHCYVGTSDSKLTGLEGSNLNYDTSQQIWTRTEVYPKDTRYYLFSLLS